uniref:Uncharacterized protein n=1 Tax=Malurus cyaneus samueli TaxID=2593467 RepID=A0A8C5UNN1_9PASS
MCRGPVQPYGFCGSPCGSRPGSVRSPGRAGAPPALPHGSPGAVSRVPPAALLPAAILGWVGGGAIKNREREEEGSAVGALGRGRQRGRGLGGSGSTEVAAGRRGGAMSDQQFALDRRRGQGGRGTDGGGGGAKIDASKNEEDEGKKITWIKEP